MNFFLCLASLTWGWEKGNRACVKQNKTHKAFDIYNVTSRILFGFLKPYFPSFLNLWLDCSVFLNKTLQDYISLCSILKMMDFKSKCIYQTKQAKFFSSLHSYALNLSSPLLCSVVYSGLLLYYTSSISQNHRIAKQFR